MTNKMLNTHQQILATETAIIVDDEPYAILALKEMLGHFEGIQIVARANNAVEALDLIQEYKPSLIFLDINMPAISGFELLNLIDPALEPKVIFITAHNEYALEAFNLNAIDYLLKPIDPVRLAQAIDKAKAYNTPFEQFIHSYKPNKLPVELLDKIFFVQCNQVIYAEIEASGLRIYTKTQAYNSKLCLSALENLNENFERISRTVMINTDFLEAVQKSERSLEITLKNGRQFLASRRASIKLKKLLFN